ncbi:MAG: CHAT domain-containing protein [Deinococcales bacterium]
MSQTATILEIELSEIKLNEYSKNFSYKMHLSEDKGELKAKALKLDLELENSWQVLGPKVLEVIKGRKNPFEKDLNQGLRELGRSLYKSLFADPEVAQFWGSVLANISQNLIIQFRINSPKLSTLPWELLHNGQDFLILDRRFVFLRYHEQLSPVAPITISEPLRVLFISAQPPNYAPLKVKQEFSALKRALTGLEERGKLELEQLEHASLELLGNKLRTDGPYHVVHIASHAKKSQGGELLLEKYGREERVKAEDLAIQLNSQSNLALVIINACETAVAETSELYPLAGLAQNLAERNIPTVIAMQLKIADDSAVKFSEAFYQSLSQGGDISQALYQARLAIHSKQFFEWLTPVLFSRVKDFRLLEMRPASQEEQLKRQERLQERLIQAEETQNWPEAKSLIAKLKALHLDEIGRQWLTEANRRIEAQISLPQDIQEITNLIEQGNLQKAARLLENLSNLHSNNRELEGLRQRLTKKRFAVKDPPVEEAHLKPSLGTVQTNISKDVEAILNNVANNQLVFVLGSNIHLGDDWQLGDVPPSDESLIKYLVAKHHLSTDRLDDLHHFAQRFLRDAALESELEDIYGKNYKPSLIHRLIAKLADGEHYPNWQPIIISFALDKVLIDSFVTARRSVDVFRPHLEQAYFVHSHFDGEDWQHEEVKRSNEYPYAMGKHPLIVQVNGCFDDHDLSTRLLAEDDHVEALYSKLMDQLPPNVLTKLRKRSRYLFLGLKLHHWHYRGIFKKLLGQSSKASLGWAVEAAPDSYSAAIWNDYKLKLLDVELDYFLTDLEKQMGELR